MPQKNIFIAHIPWISVPIHSLFCALIFLITGILTREYFPFLPTIVAIVSLFFIAAIGIIFLYNQSWLPYFLLFGGSFIVGYASLSYQYEKQKSIHPYLKESRDLDCIGTVISWEHIEHPLMRYKITYKLKKMKRPIDEKWTLDTHAIQIYTASLPAIEIDDIVAIKNLKFSAKEDRFFMRYQMRHNFFATSFIPQISVAILDRPSFSIARTLFHARKKIFDTITGKLNKASRIFIASLFFGNKSIEHKKMQHHSNNFKQWGVAHLFARSGLHLVLFIGLWHMLLRLLPLSHLVASLLLMLIATLYFLLSWSSASFARAFFVFLGYKISMIYKEPISSFHLLCMISYLFLATNPIILFFLDFQLSFGITMVIIWFFSLQRQHRCFS